MGGVLSPILANIFLCHHEQRWLDDCPSAFKPLFYRRYVDDCFLVFNNNNEANSFLQYLNNKHPNIHFTAEFETNDCLPFLDSVVHKVGNRNISTSVFRKATFTGLGLNFFSFTPMLYKLNSIKTLLYRAYTLSSSYINFHLEIEFLRQYFVNNKYPIYLFDNVVSKFLESKFKTNHVSISTVPKKIYYLKFNYYGYQSLKFRNCLKRILSGYFPHVDFRIILQNSFTLGSLASSKERIPEDLLSNVVYEYNCSGCNARYVGSTTRSFRTRKMEHMGISARTNRPLAKPSFSNIRNHSEESDHPLKPDNFKIIRKVHEQSLLAITESVYIKTTGPSLNSTMAAVPLHCCR